MNRSPYGEILRHGTLRRICFRRLPRNIQYLATRVKHRKLNPFISCLLLFFERPHVSLPYYALDNRSSFEANGYGCWAYFYAKRGHQLVHLPESPVWGREFRAERPSSCRWRWTAGGRSRGCPWPGGRSRRRPGSTSGGGSYASPEEKQSELWRFMSTCMLSSRKSVII